MSTSHFALSRRAFLSSTAALGGAVVTGLPWRAAHAAQPLLKVETRTLEVNKKAAKVYAILGANGHHGLIAQEGDRFAGPVLNASDEPLQMHWHGQMLAPAEQDRARPGGGSLPVGQSDMHDFVLTPGTHWMHSHSLSEQQLLAAPMVTREKDAGDVQDVVMMLHDFAFRSPQEILAELGGSSAHGGHGAAPTATKGSGPGMGAMPAMPGHGAGSMPGHAMRMTHANDVRYDAYLANDRTLDDPQVVTVEKSGRVRLRIINGGTATAFFLSTPGLASRCIAVDGAPCQSLAASRYPMAQGQRIDLIVEIPKEGGTFLVLAQVEGSVAQTGIVLTTTGSEIRRVASVAAKAEALLDLSFESQLAAATPLSLKKPDKAFMMMLGEEPGYRWTINGRIHGEHTPIDVRLGERVEMTFMNPTSMMHPMHLHGHHFQVVGIGGRRYAGPVRDTVIVPPHAPVTIAFDAKLKGAWFMHCHHLYHMATGMMTEVKIS
jgi:FtsP/CotA-like multicopper oxidase with cupredoxin domain